MPELPSANPYDNLPNGVRGSADTKLNRRASNQSSQDSITSKLTRAGQKIRSYHLERLRLKRQRKNAPDQVSSTLDVRRKQAGLHPTDALVAEQQKQARLSALLEGKITHKTKLQQSIFLKARRHSQMHQYLTDLPNIESRNELALRVSDPDAPPRIVTKPDEVYIDLTAKS